MADDDDRWKLTKQAIAAGQPSLEDDEEPVLGHRLLQALAAESNGRMRQIEPGVWLDSKLSTEPPIG